MAALPLAAMAGEPYTARNDLRREAIFRTLMRPPILIAPPSPSAAHELRRQAATRNMKRESWAGAIVTERGWSVYTGLTYAIFGAANTRVDGWRFRLASTASWRGGLGDIMRDPASTTASLDLFLGYHKTIGPLTLKAFAGATTNGRTMTALYTGRDIPGGTRGFKMAVETWLNLSPDLWLSVDGSASSSRSDNSKNNNSFTVASRLGYRFLPEFSAGPEVAFYGDTYSSGGRFGGFVRYEWETGEISASGGVTGSALDLDHDRTAGYGNLTWVSRF